MSSKTYRAILIGNSEYPGDRDLAALEGPRNDLALLRDALCDDDIGLVPSDNIRLVPEREAADIRKETEDFFQSATTDDVLLLYYSGHGALNFKNELFLCARDTKLDRLRTTSVPSAEIRQFVSDSRASAVVVLLDCCHSGKFKSAHSGGILAGEGTFVLTSSRPGELANDTETANRASRFTHHLVEGLRTGAEDEDRDGLVTVHDVYTYVYRKMSELQGSVPQRHFSGDGVVPLARRSAGPLVVDHPVLAADAPELDIPWPVIELGKVELGVEIPIERVAVVNRGGGTLDWTCESTADWVLAERDGSELSIRLTPGVGKHRANVYVRDGVAGIVKSVRVSVEVIRPPQPLEATPEHEFLPPDADPEQEPSDGDRTPLPDDDSGVKAGGPVEHRFVAAWYDDPSKRFQYRYYDGAEWTDHVASEGTMSDDAVSLDALPSASRRTRAVVYFVSACLSALTMVAGIVDVAGRQGPHEEFPVSASEYVAIVALALGFLALMWGARRAWKWTNDRE